MFNRLPSTIVRRGLRKVIKTFRFWPRYRSAYSFCKLTVFVVCFTSTLVMRGLIGEYACRIEPHDFHRGRNTGGLPSRVGFTAIRGPADWSLRYERRLASSPAAASYGLSTSSPASLQMIATTTASRGDLLSVREIQHTISLTNTACFIHNQDIYGPIDNATAVIVVQVHSRAGYLKHLIAALAASKDIRDAVVIFSHDLFDIEINKLISRVEFCRYAQIYFPFSIQTHPGRFPGDDPRDCPPRMKRADADRLNCLNAEWPDTYGHYREARFSQIKHHWWWKAWHLFEGGFRPLNDYTGDFIFLEEDNFVLEDFIAVHRRLKNQSKAWCSECAVISLGNHMKRQDLAGNKVEISQWVSSKHNMGMAFGRSTWNIIKKCASEFCRFDDYNWDWSLMFVGITCTRPQLMALTLMSSRVFHIGVCGVHHKENCDATPILRRAQAASKAYAMLYPTNFTYQRAMYRVTPPVGNGGWGDIRDRALCLNLTDPNFLKNSCH